MSGTDDNEMKKKQMMKATLEKMEMCLKYLKEECEIKKYKLSHWLDILDLEVSVLQHTLQLDLMPSFTPPSSPPQAPPLPAFSSTSQHQDPYLNTLR